MKKIAIRNPCTDEIPVLQDIWKTVFGEDGRASFFEHFFSCEHTVVAGHEGKIAAMGYIVPMGELIAGAAPLPCAMLYAIATLPSFRGEGIGAAVVCELISAAYKQGFTAVVLCPSADSLFEYYSSRTQLREWFYTDEKGISAASAVKGKALPGMRMQPVKAVQKSALPGTALRELSPSQYGEFREIILKNTPHIKHSLSYLEYQKLLCDELGGGLFRIGDSCAVAEMQQDGAVWVKELLVSGSDSESDITRKIAAAFPAYKFIYRFPAKSGQGRRFGMLAAKNGVYGSAESASAPWYGLAFD